jgi:hypothetical protein
VCFRKSRILKRDTERVINNLTKYVENISEGTNARVNVHIVQTKNELDKHGQEIINSSKFVLASIS